MKKRVRAEDVEALIKEIDRYRAHLKADRNGKRAPKRPGGDKSAK